MFFDETFHTVALLPTGDTPHDQWHQILKFPHDRFDDVDENSRANLPQEFIKWLNGSENPPHVPIDTDSEDDPTTTLRRRPDLVPFPAVLDNAHDIDAVSEGDHYGAPEGEHANKPELPLVVSDEVQTKRPQQNVKTWKDGPAIIHKLPIDGESYDFTFNAVTDPAASMVLHPGYSTSQPTRSLRKQSLFNCTLLQHCWTVHNDHDNYLLMDLDNPHLVDNVHDPCTLEAHAAMSKYNDDNPSFDMAVQGPFQAEYWEAMKSELDTL